MKMKCTRHVLFDLLVLVPLPMVAGCGNTTKVKGQVLFDGQPLPGGILSFTPGEGNPGNLMTATIQEDGTFVMADAPIGPVKVSIANTHLKPEDPKGKERRDKGEAPSGRRLARYYLRPQAIEQIEQQADAPKIGRYVKIPEKYYNPATSSITIQVQRGGDAVKIELVSK
jgi:hypothetical protein